MNYTKEDLYAVWTILAFIVVGAFCFAMVITVIQSALYR